LRRSFSPGAIRPPFGRYSHAVSLDAPQKLLVISGQLAVRPDGSVPEDVGEQTAVVLAAIDACLAEAGMERSDVLRLSAYITEPEHREAYMRVRDAWVADPPPDSTLLVVKALALPACKVEIEAIAGR